MRRWIFAALVLANLGMLLWGLQYIEPERPAQTLVQQEINPEKMRLLSEIPPGKLIPRPKPPPPPPPPPIVDASTCYRLGPLAEIARSKRVEESLNGQSLAFTKREETVRGISGYRVLLPPLASREQAEQKRRELTRLGFSDHALMQEEGFRNAVSLGLFAVEANARSRLQSLLEKGVVAKLEPIEQTRTVFWFELQATASSADLPSRLKTMLDGMSGVEVSEMPCPAPVVPVNQQ